MFIGFKELWVVTREVVIGDASVEGVHEAFWVGGGVDLPDGLVLGGRKLQVLVELFPQVFLPFVLTFLIQLSTLKREEIGLPVLPLLSLISLSFVLLLPLL